jgi:hypothetical protein
MNAGSTKVLQQQQYFNGGTFCPLDFWCSGQPLGSWGVILFFWVLFSSGGEGWKILNRPKEMSAVSTKILLRFFRPICPFARFIFTLWCLGMFWVHVMHVMNTHYGYKGVCNLLLGMLCEVTIKTCHIIWGIEWKTCLGVTWENMDEANGQTGRTNRWRTFVFIAFISFRLCNIFAHGKYCPVCPFVSLSTSKHYFSSSRSQVRHSQIGPGLN